jgi:hypothetical protein
MCTPQSIGIGIGPPTWVVGGRLVSPLRPPERGVNFYFFYSDTVYIPPSKIPYNGATYFEALFGCPGRSVTSICPSLKSLLLCVLAVG